MFDICSIIYDYRMEDLQGPKVGATNARKDLVCFFYLRVAHLRWFVQDACHSAREAYCVFR